MKCRHGFHKECVDQWLTIYNNSCPLCRFRQVEDDAVQNDDSPPMPQPPQPPNETPAHPRIVVPGVPELVNGGSMTIMIFRN